MAMLVVSACADRNEPEARKATEAPPAANTTSSTARSTPTVTEARPAPAVVTVRLDDYAIQPSSVVAPAGEVTFQATNGDAVPHDLVVVRAAVAGRLPTSGIRLDEADPRIEVVGRTPRLSPNASASVTATLAPGSYVLVCSVPHHYVRDSMAAALTITP